MQASNTICRGQSSARHAQAVQLPNPPPAAGLLHNPAEGFEQLPLFAGSDTPLAQTIAQGLGLFE